MSYDQVAVRMAGGGWNLLSVEEFERMPYADRAELIIRGRVQFLRDGEPVSTRQALGIEEKDPISPPRATPPASTKR